MPNQATSMPCLAAGSRPSRREGRRAASAGAARHGGAVVPAAMPHIGASHLTGATCNRILMEQVCCIELLREEGGGTVAQAADPLGGGWAFSLEGACKARIADGIRSVRIGPNLVIDVSGR